MLHFPVATEVVSGGAAVRRVGLRYSTYRLFGAMQTFLQSLYRRCWSTEQRPRAPVRWRRRSFGICVITTGSGAWAACRPRCPKVRGTGSIRRYAELCAPSSARTSRMRSESSVRISCMPSQPFSFLIGGWRLEQAPASWCVPCLSRSRAVPPCPGAADLFATRPKSPLQPEAALCHVCNANLLRTRGDEAIAKPIMKRTSQGRRRWVSLRSTHPTILRFRRFRTTFPARWPACRSRRVGAPAPWRARWCWRSATPHGADRAPRRSSRPCAGPAPDRLRP